VVSSAANAKQGTISESQKSSSVPGSAREQRDNEMNDQDRIDFNDITSSIVRPIEICATPIKGKPPQWSFRNMKPFFR
jgi:hypothetical protein